LKRSVVRILIALILVECALQAVDWLRWRRQFIALDRPLIPGTVLCVGDDDAFDVGVRSREDSWPVRAGHEFAVVRNFALPAMDSAELLEQLPEWLDTQRPEVVFIGIGDADFRRRTTERVDPLIRRWLGTVLLVLVVISVLCVPMGYIITQAGGAVSNGERDVLSINPVSIHDRTPIYIGGKREIKLIEKFS